MVSSLDKSCCFRRYLSCSLCIVTSKLEDYSGLVKSNVRRKTETDIPAMAVTGRGRSKAETLVKEPTLVILPPTGATGYYNHIIIAAHLLQVDVLHSSSSSSQR